MSSSRHVAIIDYGMGNLHSVASAVKHVAPQVEVSITPDAAVIDAADHVIFPGVGAIRDCIGEIKRLQVHRPLRRALDAGKPVLAVCVGMQALVDFSEENDGVECLGILPGRGRRFPAHALDADGSELNVPHIGWNQVHQTIDHPLWHGIEQDRHFYFVHSYYVEPAEPGLIAATSDYGLQFCAAMARDNLFATQFHPEKSHRDGLQLYKNFVQWDGRL